MTPQQIVDTINNPQRTQETVFDMLIKFIDENKLDEALLHIQKNFNCNEETAKQVLNLFEEQIYKELKKTINDAIQSLSPEQKTHNQAVAREWQNKPTCPTCKSTKIEKISTSKKIFGGAMFGLFSSDVRNTMCCKNCGYKW